MLKSIVSTLFTLFVFASAFAQYNVVRETERNMSFGSRPCFRLEFANTEASLVEDKLKDYVRQSFDGKLKKDKKSGEWFATGLKSAMMGEDPFAIYATTEKGNGVVALNVWFDAGAYFLNRRDNSRAADEVARSLQSFYFEVRRAAIAQELKKEESKLKEMESRQRKLERDNESLRKDIENYKAKIKKAEEDILANEKNQETGLKDLDGQRRAIEEVKRRMDNVENERN